jgi:C-terminal processing protease CtpA/Prc
MKKISIAIALLLAIAFVEPAAHAQQPDDRKPDVKKERQPDARKGQMPAPSPVDELKKKLSLREEEIVKIRQEMLREVEAEEKKVAEALKKEQEAVRTGNREAIQRATELQLQKTQLQLLRISIQNGQPLNGRRPLAPAADAPNLPDDLRLGLHGTPVTSILKDQLGLAKNEGMVLLRVDADSPAGKVGLKVHDILIKIDGKIVSGDRREFLKMLGEIKLDAPIEVVIMRAGKQQTVAGLTLPARQQPRAAPKD